MLGLTSLLSLPNRHGSASICKRPVSNVVAKSIGKGGLPGGCALSSFDLLVLPVEHGTYAGFPLSLLVLCHACMPCLGLQEDHSDGLSRLLCKCLAALPQTWEVCCWFMCLLDLSIYLEGQAAGRQRPQVQMLCYGRQHAHPNAHPLKDEHQIISCTLLQSIGRACYHLRNRTSHKICSRVHVPHPDGGRLCEESLQGRLSMACRQTGVSSRAVQLSFGMVGIRSRLGTGC